jgi:hypothetical protein
MVRRILAGAFFVAVMTLSMAGVAAAQSKPSGPPGPSGPTSPGGGGGGEVTTTTVKAAGATLGRTGTEMWIPLAVGGGVIGIALAARTLGKARSIT